MTTSTVSSRPRPRTDSKDRPRSAGNRKPPQNLKTWAFDSVGPRKYALQIRKAGNGNPCFRIVEGLPQDDGTYRKFNVTIWSEDFDSFFRVFDELRQYIQSNNIRTPDGHKYVPGKPKGGARHR